MARTPTTKLLQLSTVLAVGFSLTIGTVRVVLSMMPTSSAAGIGRMQRKKKETVKPVLVVPTLPAQEVVGSSICLYSVL